MHSLQLSSKHKSCNKLYFMQLPLKGKKIGCVYNCICCIIEYMPDRKKTSAFTSHLWELQLPLAIL